MPATAETIKASEAELLRIREELRSILAAIRSDACAAISPQYFAIARKIGRSDPETTMRLGEEKLKKLVSDIQSAAGHLPAVLTGILDEDWIDQCFRPVKADVTMTKLDGCLQRVYSYTCDTERRISNSPYPELLKLTLGGAFARLGFILRGAGFSTGSGSPDLGDEDENDLILENFDLPEDVTTHIVRFGELARQWAEKRRQLDELETTYRQERADALWALAATGEESRDRESGTS